MTKDEIRAKAIELADKYAPNRGQGYTAETYKWQDELMLVEMANWVLENSKEPKEESWKYPYE